MLILKHSISIAVLCSTIFIVPSDLLTLRRANLRSSSLFCKDSGVAQSVHAFHTKLNMGALIAAVQDCDDSWDAEELNRGECYEVIHAQKYVESPVISPVVTWVNGESKIPSATRRALVRMRSLLNHCTDDGFYQDGYLEIITNSEEYLHLVFTFNRKMPTLYKDKNTTSDMATLDCNTAYEVVYSDRSKADVKFEKGGWVFDLTWK